MAPSSHVCQVFALFRLLQTNQKVFNSKLVLFLDEDDNSHARYTVSCVMVPALHVETGLIRTFISVTG